MKIRLPFLAMLAPISIGFLSACSTSGEKYPSLALRPEERSQSAADSAAVLHPGPARRETLQMLPQSLDLAESAHAHFLGLAQRAAPLVEAAIGQSIESNDWALAQIALSELDAARSQTAVSLSDLDLAFASATLSFEARSQIVKTRDEVIVLIREEDRVLAQLRGKIDQ